MSMTKTHSSQKYVFRIWQCWSTCFFLQNLLLAQKRLNVIKSTKMRVGIIFTQRHISIPKLNTVSSYWQQEKTVFNQQKYKNTIIFILVWKYAFFFNINICRLHKYFCGFYVLDFMWIYVSDLMWIYVLDFLWMYVLDVPEQSFKGERIKSKAMEVFHFWEEKMKMTMKHPMHSKKNNAQLL